MSWKGWKEPWWDSPDFGLLVAFVLGVFCWTILFIRLCT